MSRVGIFIGDKEVVKRYVGSRLAWKKKRQITLYTSESFSMYSSILRVKYSFSQDDISLMSIDKIVLMDDYTIRSNSISGVQISSDTLTIEFSSGLNSIANFRGYVPDNAKVEVYLK